jgi:hypothetical protein
LAFFISESCLLASAIIFLVSRKKEASMPVESDTTKAKLSSAEREFVNEARKFLETPGLLIRIANKAGKPIEAGMNLLPEKYRKVVQDATQKALIRGLVLMTSSLQRSPERKFTEASAQSRKLGLLHSAAAFGTGAIGGAFGLSALVVELPVTTGIMLRSIAAIADEFKMDLRDPRVQLECLYVLSLGSPKAGSKSNGSDDMEFAYWSSRIAFSQTIQQAASFLGRAIARETELAASPVLLRFIAQVAARFEIVVSEKAIAQLVPAIGAVGGGIVNAAFTDYFSTAARYHFGLRALEEKCGEAEIRAAYGKTP